MANFTAKDVNDLRKSTGVGLMDCKKALTEADGDVEKAIVILREKGLANQAKKADRIAAEGAVIAITNADNTAGAIVEVNSETDFVAQNEEFVGFCEGLAQTVLDTDQFRWKKCRFRRKRQQQWRECPRRRIHPRGETPRQQGPGQQAVDQS